MSEPIIIETFKSMRGYALRDIESQNPSCFKGNVNFRKTRVTIEDIDEPVEVLAERLQQLWDVCDNHHHWNPLNNAAKSIGYQLKGSAGSKRSKKP